MDTTRSFNTTLDNLNITQTMINGVIGITKAVINVTEVVNNVTESTINARGGIHNVTGCMLNGTDCGTESSAGNVTVKKVMNVMLLVIMVVVMVSLGCTISVAELKHQLRRPTAIIIGMVCQFIIYPLSVFGLAHALTLEKWDALGLMLLGTCPGGHISNIMTLWSSGNTALSVAMTALSTAIGVGMMPLNLWIYSRSWTDDAAVVPYKNIMIALVCLVAPVPIGMFIYRKWPKVAIWFARIGSTLGFLIIVVYLIMSIFEYTDIFRTSWKLWFAAIILPIQGLILGYVFTSIFGMPHVIRRTVAIEISSQNVGICLTIIAISFPLETRLRIMAIPLIFAQTTSATLISFVALFRLYRSCVDKKLDNAENDDPEKKIEHIVLKDFKPNSKDQNEDI